MPRASMSVAVALCVAAGVLSVGMVMLFDQVEHILLFLMIPTMFLLGVMPIALRMARGTFDIFEITIPYFVLYFLFYGVGAIFTLLIHGVAYDTGVAPYLDEAVAYCTLGLACAM